MLNSTKHYNNNDTKCQGLFYLAQKIKERLLNVP